MTIGSAFHVIPATLTHEEFGKLAWTSAVAVTTSGREGQGHRAAHATRSVGAQGAPDRKNWSYDGIVAYSKVCTHVGCPVALYEQHTHHLLCPCHQSQFDVSEHEGDLRTG